MLLLICQRTYEWSPRLVQSFEDRLLDVRHVQSLRSSQVGASHTCYVRHRPTVVWLLVPVSGLLVHVSESTLSSLNLVNRSNMFCTVQIVDLGARLLSVAVCSLVVGPCHNLASHRRICDTSPCAWSVDHRSHSLSSRSLIRACVDHTS